MIEIKIPSPGESITEVDISSWMKADGAYVKNGDELFEIESDKATLTVSADADGQLKILLGEGETVEVGSVAGTIDNSVAAPAGDSSTSEKKETSISAPSAVASANENETYAKGVPSVTAAKLMAEKGLQSNDIQGTGRDGRITKGDVLQHSGKPAAPVAQSTVTPATTSSKPAASPKSAASPVVPHSGISREISRKRMSSLRRKISERLVSVKNETAMLTTFNEVDLSKIMEVRKQYKEAFKEHHEIGLGFMSFFTKAVTEALKAFPAVGAMIEGNEMVYHDYADVGIAVSAPKGLMVPVMRNAESLTLAQIEQEVRRLALRARDGKLSLDEMTGGNFTITNGGVFGSLLSTPIINPPQSAILGMHKIEERPMAINGKVEIRPMMYVALSYDHRVIDGRESVGFLVKVKEYLEDPIRFLLGI